jgi:hypothetical protein
VEYLMMRYFEQKVCDFAVMVLRTKSKNMEILIPKAKEIPKKRESSLHLMSNSDFYVVWDDVTSKWCTRGNKLGNYQQLIHPLISSPEENHWLTVLTKYLAIEDIEKAILGFKLNIRASTTSSESDLFRCHPNLYSQGCVSRPWYDFANVRFDMVRGLFESFPEKVILFSQVTLICGKKEVVCVIQQFKYNEKSKKTATKLLPLLQQDRFSNKLCVVPASTMNSKLVLPCKFPDNCTSKNIMEFVVLPPQSTWDTIGWPAYQYLVYFHL